MRSLVIQVIYLPSYHTGTKTRVSLHLTQCLFHYLLIRLVVADEESSKAVPRIGVIFEGRRQKASKNATLEIK